MVRVTKDDYVRLRALEQAAKEFAGMDYKETRSELAIWKATFEMLSDKGAYDGVLKMKAKLNTTKAKFIHRHPLLEKELGLDEDHNIVDVEDENVEKTEQPETAQ